MATAPIPPVPQQPKGADGAAGPGSRIPSLAGGDTTIDDTLTFEVDLASHATMREIARLIRLRLDPHLTTDATTAIVFLDNALRLALDIRSTVEIQLRNITEAYAGAAATARGGLEALAAKPSRAKPKARAFSAFPSLAAPGVADAAVAILGALKTDTRYFGRQVVIPEQAFALSLAHQWEDSEVVEFHYVTLFAPPTSQDDEVLKEFVSGYDAAVEQRRTAMQATANLLARVTQLPAADPTLPLVKAALEAARDQFQSAEASFDDLSTKLTTADEKTGLTQLQLLQRGELVRSIATRHQGRVFYLYAQIVAAGGAFRVTKNVLRSLFGWPGLEHAGGCIATFGLFDVEGRLVAADTIGARPAYVDSRRAIFVGESSVGVRPPEARSG